MTAHGYHPVIGLEVHIELKTKSKMFCGCKNDPFFAPKPNIYTCPVCLGLPGALPVPNRTAIEWCVKLGLALHCSVPEMSKFDRKNYFYPDLPKGYQISQYDQPLCAYGWVLIGERKIGICRVHQEEDTGKLHHELVDGKKMTLVDFNRSGVPLVEIVTDPDFRTIDEVDQYLKKLRRVIRYLDISNADLEKGSMRLEPSISLQKDGEKTLPGYRVELKNINSFRFVRQAIEFEIERQAEIIASGKTPVQQTRGWDSIRKETFAQRSKEDAQDYRYFPEPDIPPMRWEKSKIAEIQSHIGELPDAKIDRFQEVYGVSLSDSELLTETKERADYFEACVALTKTTKEFSSIQPKIIANTLINRSIDFNVTKPRDLLMSLSQEKADNAVDSSIIQKTVTDVLSANPKAVLDYKSGKTTVLMFLVGQVKKALRGKGDAKLIETVLKEAL